MPQSWLACPTGHDGETVRVLLDNNAINDLFRSPLGAEVRRRLRRDIRRGRLEILFSVMQMTEVAGTYPRPEHHRQLIGEMLQLCRRRLLQAYPHRLRDELRLGRREMLYRRRETKRLLHRAFDLDLAKAADDQRRTVKAWFERRELEARAKVAARENVDVNWPAWLAYWGADRTAVISDWALDRLAKEYRLPRTDERIVALDPRRFPTLWCDMAFHLARIALTARATRPPSGNDAYDQAHFSDAAYANVLVTSDGAFREIVRETAFKRPRLLTFAEFANEIGVVVGAPARSERARVART